MGRWTAAAALLLAATPAPLRADLAPPLRVERLEPEEGSPPPGLLERIVTFDVLFWDDTLPPGEGVGQVIFDLEIIGWDGEAYTVADRFQVPVDDVTPVMDAPLTKQLGRLSFSLRTEGDRLIGRLMDEQQVDLSRITVFPWSALDPVEAQALTLLADVPEGNRVFTEDLAPMPVPMRIDVMEPVDGGEPTISRALIPFERPLAAELAPLGPGARVRTTRGEAEVVDVDGDLLTLRGVDRRSMPALRIPNPQDRRLALGWALGALAGGILLLRAASRAFGRRL